MLVLVRKKQEVIVVRVPGHKPIRITSVDRGARLAFEAPLDVEINRLEVDRQKYPHEYREAA